MQKSAFERISIGFSFENFLVFLVVGFLVIVIGRLFVDLTGDLPEWYLGLIQEPISIAYFFILSIVSLIGIALATCGGRRNHIGKWWFEKILLAPCRAGINCGFIASGMLIGIGVGLFLVTRGAPYSELAEISIAFLALGIFCLSVAYPVSLLMLYLINQNTKHNRIIDFFGALYVAFIIFAAFRFREHLDWVGLGIVLSVLIVYAFIDRKWLRNADDKSRNSDGASATDS